MKERDNWIPCTKCVTVSTLSWHSSAARPRTRRPRSPLAPCSLVFQWSPIGLQSILDKPVKLLKENKQRRYQSRNYNAVDSGNLIERATEMTRRFHLHFLFNSPFEWTECSRRWWMKFDTSLNVTMKSDSWRLLWYWKRLVGNCRWWTCKTQRFHSLPTAHMADDLTFNRWLSPSRVDFWSLQTQVHENSFI